MLLLLPFELWLSQVAAACPELHMASAQKVNQNFIGSRYKLHTHTQTHNMSSSVCVWGGGGLLASIVYISTRLSFPLMMSSTFFTASFLRLVFLCLSV